MAYEDSISIEVSHGDVSRIPTAKKAWINSIQMTNALVPWCPHFDRSPTGLRVHLQRAILNVHHWDFPNGLGIIWIGWGKVFFPKPLGFRMPYFQTFSDEATKKFAASGTAGPSRRAVGAGGEEGCGD